jgi:hypothetical protein
MGESAPAYEERYQERERSNDNDEQHEEDKCGERPVTAKWPGPENANMPVWSVERCPRTPDNVHRSPLP